MMNLTDKSAFQIQVSGLKIGGSLISKRFHCVTGIQAGKWNLLNLTNERSKDDGISQAFADHHLQTWNCKNKNSNFNTLVMSQPGMAHSCKM